ncbi:hypothetical protein TXIAM_110020 [Tenacibaculum xiamenense]
MKRKNEFKNGIYILSATFHKVVSSYKMKRFMLDFAFVLLKSL